MANEFTVVTHALGWVPTPTRSGHIKAVGNAEHTGRVLYGAEADRALHPTQGAAPGAPKEYNYGGNKSQPAPEPKQPAPTPAKDTGEVLNRIQEGSPLHADDVHMFAEEASSMPLVGLQAMNARLQERVDPGVVSELRDKAKRAPGTHVRGDIEVPPKGQREQRFNGPLVPSEIRKPAKIALDDGEPGLPNAHLTRDQYEAASIEGHKAQGIRENREKDDWIKKNRPNLLVKPKAERDADVRPKTDMYSTDDERKPAVPKPTRDPAPVAKPSEPQEPKNYMYRGTDAQGNPANGKLQANSHEEAHAELAKRGHKPSEMYQSGVANPPNLAEGIPAEQPKTAKVVSANGKVSDAPQVEPTPAPAKPALASVPDGQATEKLKADYDERVARANRDLSGDHLGTTLKQLGMEHSAAMRKATGNLTGKEKDEIARRESTNHVGKQVAIGDQHGEIVGHAFGKVKVKFADGSQRTVHPDDVRSLAKTVPAPVEKPKTVPPPLPAKPADKPILMPSADRKPAKLVMDDAPDVEQIKTRQATKLADAKQRDQSTLNLEKKHAEELAQAKPTAPEAPAQEDKPKGKFKSRMKKLGNRILETWMAQQEGHDGADEHFEAIKNELAGMHPTEAQKTWDSAFGGRKGAPVMPSLEGEPVAKRPDTKPESNEWDANIASPRAKVDAPKDARTNDALDAAMEMDKPLPKKAEPARAAPKAKPEDAKPLPPIAPATTQADHDERHAEYERQQEVAKGSAFSPDRVEPADPDHHDPVLDGPNSTYIDEDGIDRPRTENTIFDKETGYHRERFAHEMPGYEEKKPESPKPKTPKTKEKKAKVPKKYPSHLRYRASKDGFNPDDVDAHAEELRRLHNEDASARNSSLKSIRESFMKKNVNGRKSGGDGYFGGTDDHTQIPWFGTFANDAFAEHPHLFQPERTHGHRDDQLHAMLSDGNFPLLSKKDAHAQALKHFHEQAYNPEKEEHAKREEDARKDHSPPEIAGTLREWEGDAQAETDSDADWGAYYEARDGEEETREEDGGEFGFDDTDYGDARGGDDSERDDGPSEPVAESKSEPKVEAAKPEPFARLNGKPAPNVGRKGPKIQTAAEHEAEVTARRAKQKADKEASQAKPADPVPEAKPTVKPEDQKWLDEQRAARQNPDDPTLDNKPEAKSESKGKTYKFPASLHPTAKNIEMPLAFPVAGAESVSHDGPNGEKVRAWTGKSGYRYIEVANQNGGKAKFESHPNINSGRFGGITTRSPGSAVGASREDEHIPPEDYKRTSEQTAKPTIGNDPPPSRFQHHAIASRIATGGTATKDEADAARQAYKSMSDADKVAYAKSLGHTNAHKALPETRDELVDRSLREGVFRGEQEAKGLKDTPTLHEGALFGEKGIGESAGIFDDVGEPEDAYDEVEDGPKPKSDEEVASDKKREVDDAIETISGFKGPNVLREEKNVEYWAKNRHAATNKGKSFPTRDEYAEAVIKAWKEKNSPKQPDSLPSKPAVSSEQPHPSKLSDKDLAAEMRANNDKDNAGHEFTDDEKARKKLVAAEHLARKKAKPAAPVAKPVAKPKPAPVAPKALPAPVELEDDDDQGPSNEQLEAMIAEQRKTMPTDAEDDEPKPELPIPSGKLKAAPATVPEDVSDEEYEQMAVDARKKVDEGLKKHEEASKLSPEEKKSPKAKARSAKIPAVETAATPEVVWHGGSEGQSPSVKHASDSLQFGPGVYFGGRGVAEEWAGERPNGKAKQYKLHLKAPFDERSAKADDPRHEKFIGLLANETGMSADSIHADYGGLGTLDHFRKMLGRKSPDNSGFPGGNKINELLRQAGFDGAIARFRDGLQHVAFDDESFSPHDDKEAPAIAARDPGPSRFSESHASRLKAIVEKSSDPDALSEKDVQSVVDEASKLMPKDLHELLVAAGVEGSKPTHAKGKLLDRLKNHLTATRRSRERAQA